MLRVKVARQLFNLFIRGSSLVARFFLSFYIIRYLGLEDSGIYGLTLGGVALVPAVIGWGLNYFMCRGVVGLSRTEAGIIIKSRYVVTFASLFVLVLLTLAIFGIGGWTLPRMTGLIIAIVCLETVALDTHLALIGLEMTMQANVLLFVRSALWVPPVIGLCILYPQFRSIDTIFAAWCLSYFAAIGAFAFFFRDWPVREILAAPIRWSWVKNVVSKSWLVYFSDLGLVGFSYSDRFIVSALLGLDATGVFTFYWSLSNAVQNLVSSSLVQFAQPRLVRAYLDPDRRSWGALLRAEFIKAVGTAIFLGVIIYVVGSLLVNIMNLQAVGQYKVVFAIIMIASVARVGSDAANLGLTSSYRDVYYCLINIGGVALSTILTYLFTSKLGMLGAAMSMVVSAILLLAARLFVCIEISRDRALRPSEGSDHNVKFVHGAPSATRP